MPVPSQATLYRLVTTLAHPGELPSGPVRQMPASFEGRAFTHATALRPGEQVQINTTRLDALAFFDDGTRPPRTQHARVHPVVESGISLHKAKRCREGDVRRGTASSIGLRHDKTG